VHDYLAADGERARVHKGEHAGHGDENPGISACLERTGFYFAFRSTVAGVNSARPSIDGGPARFLLG